MQPRINITCLWRPGRLLYQGYRHSIMALLALGMSACQPQEQPADIIRIAAITVPNTPWYDGWMVFSQRLAAHDSQFEPVFYIYGQLGSEESSLSQLRRGRIQLGGYSLQGASSVVPELGLLLAPYLFDSREQLDFIMDHYLNGAFATLFETRGLILLNWAEVGWTNLYGKQAFLTPADTAHRKLRSSNASASQLLITAIGADIVPLPFPDILPSLQTGLIDGGESGTIFYALAGLPKEAPHLTLTRHAFDTGMFLANRQWFKSLNLQQQQQLRQSLPSLDEFRSAVRAAEQVILNAPEQHGIILHELTEQQRQQWQHATFANHQYLIESIGGKAGEIYELIQRGKHAHAEASRLVDKQAP